MKVAGMKTLTWNPLTQLYCQYCLFKITMDNLTMVFKGKYIYVFLYVTQCNIATQGS